MALSSEAQIATAVAQRYITQLCKHFEHRLPARYWAEWGSIEFPTGTCRMEARPNLLILRAEAKDEAALGQLEEVVTRHLERFAFRARPEIAWRRDPLNA
jgi:hypothetical protein